MTTDRDDDNSFDPDDEADVEAIPFETLSAYLDGELDPEQRSRVEQWLAESEELQRELEEMESVDQRLRRWSRDVEPATIETVLEEESKQADRETSRTDVSSPKRGGESGRGREGSKWSIAAAAAVLCLLGVGVLYQSAMSTDDRPGWEEWLRAMAGDHQKYASGVGEMELKTGDAGRVDEWFADQHGLEVSKPEWNSEALLGANRCSLLGETIAASYLEEGDRFVSVYAIDADAIGSTPDSETGFPGECEVHDGFEACHWRRNSWQMVAISEVADRPLSTQLQEAVANRRSDDAS